MNLCDSDSTSDTIQDQISLPSVQSEAVSTNCDVLQFADDTKFYVMQRMKQICS